MGESNSINQVSEISILLDLLRSFFLINYQRGVTDRKNIGLFHAFIINKIKRIYADYFKFLLEAGDESFNEFRSFTVTVLLKMLHRKSLIFDFNTIESYSQLPFSTFATSSIDAVKIYY